MQEVRAEVHAGLVPKVGWAQIASFAKVVKLAVPEGQAARGM